MRPIRVLHILHSMNRGGAENAIINYHRFIDREKVQFDYLLTCKEKCSFEDEILSLGGKVFRVPLLRISNPNPYIKGVDAFFKQHKEYQIIHSHTSSKSTVPLWIGKKNGIPVRISHAHNTRTEKGLSGLIRDFLKRPLKSVATHYFACGEEAGIWLYGKEVFSRGLVTIMPNVIRGDLFDYSPSKREKIRQSLHINNSTIVIGCTARFHWQKNHDFLLDVFHDFSVAHPDTVLLLVGDGELRDEIANKATRLNIDDKVIFLGVVPNVYDYEQAMDLFLMTSHHEGLPLSLVEAQVSGLPCLVSENISREADLTGLVHLLPIDQGTSQWVKEMENHLDDQRHSYLDLVQKNGYDAATSAKQLEHFYLSCVSQLG